MKKNYDVLKYIEPKLQLEKICIKAVENNWLAIQYVHSQTFNICKIAILQDYRALAYIKNCTLEICVLALQQSEDASCFNLHYS